MNDVIYCWVCQGIERPDGPQRLALCEAHLTDVLRAAREGSLGAGD